MQQVEQIKNKNITAISSYDDAVSNECIKKFDCRFCFTGHSTALLYLSFIRVDIPLQCIFLSEYGDTKTFNGNLIACNFKGVIQISLSPSKPALNCQIK